MTRLALNSSTTATVPEPCEPLLAARDQSICQCHLEPAFGDMRIEEIEFREAQRFVTGRRNRLVPQPKNDSPPFFTPERVK